MHIFGVCICPDEINAWVFGVWPAMNSGIIYVDQFFRRFSRFFI